MTQDTSPIPVDISRDRIERLKEMGCADYIHMAMLDKIDALSARLAEVEAARETWICVAEHEKARAEAAEANCEKWRSMWEKEQSYNEELDAERDALAAKLALAVEALGALMDLNDNGGPFGGELYRDRVDRAWDNARATLAQLTAAPKEGKDDDQ